MMGINPTFLFFLGMTLGSKTNYLAILGVYPNPNRDFFGCECMWKTTFHVKFDIFYNSYPVAKSDSMAGAISFTAVTIQCSINLRLFFFLN